MKTELDAERESRKASRVASESIPRNCNSSLAAFSTAPLPAPVAAETATATAYSVVGVGGGVEVGVRRPGLLPMNEEAGRSGRSLTPTMSLFDLLGG